VGRFVSLLIWVFDTSLYKFRARRRMKRFGNESWLPAGRWRVVWVTGVGRIGYQSLPVGVWAVCPRRLVAKDFLLVRRQRFA
jgi:hypothetical protein